MFQVHPTHLKWLWGFSGSRLCWVLAQEGNKCTTATVMVLNHCTFQGSAPRGAASTAAGPVPITWNQHTAALAQGWGCGGHGGDTRGFPVSLGQAHPVQHPASSAALTWPGAGGLVLPLPIIDPAVLAAGPVPPHPSPCFVAACLALDRCPPPRGVCWTMGIYSCSPTTIPVRDDAEEYLPSERPPPGLSDCLLDPPVSRSCGMKRQCYCAGRV